MLTVKDIQKRLRDASRGAGCTLARDDTWQVLVDLEARDRIGIECGRIVARSHSMAVSEPGMVAAWADVLCRRLSYLQEPLRICEADTDQVLVRSWPLGPADEGQAFYELRLCCSRTDALEVSRYVVDRRTRRRSRTRMLFSYDVLTRLVNDLLDTAPRESETAVNRLPSAAPRNLPERV